MANLKQAFLGLHPPERRPTDWKRYIYDIWMTWTHGRETLNVFLVCLNDFHPDIKFTWDISKTEAVYLEVRVLKGERFASNGILDIRTHFKPTNSFLYVHGTSEHPPSVFKVISHLFKLTRFCLLRVPLRPLLPSSLVFAFVATLLPRPEWPVTTRPDRSKYLFFLSRDCVRVSAPVSPDRPTLISETVWPLPFGRSHIFPRARRTHSRILLCTDYSITTWRIDDHKRKLPRTPLRRGDECPLKLTDFGAKKARSTINGSINSTSCRTQRLGRRTATSVRENTPPRSSSTNSSERLSAPAIPSRTGRRISWDYDRGR